MLIYNSGGEQLELIRDIRSQKQSNSLLGVFRCKTGGGARLLRQNLLSPLVEVDEISLRIEAVRFLLGNETLRENLSTALNSLADTDVTIAKFSYRPHKRDENHFKRIIKSCIKLRWLLEGLGGLYAALEVAQEVELLEGLRSKVDPSQFKEIYDELSEVLCDDLPVDFKTAKDFRFVLLKAVKAFRNDFLDAAREKFSDLSEDVLQYGDQLKCSFPELNLKVENSESRGYFLSYKTALANNCPPEFVNQVRKGGRTWCSTNRILWFNERMKEVRSEIHRMTYNELDSLCQTIEKYMQPLYLMSDCICTIDLLLSMIRFSFDFSPCELPEVRSTGATVINKARHPLMESEGNQFVPLSYNFSETRNFQIVTAPNGAGKSTYLKTLAVNVVLAQIGCPVPAENARIRVADQLLPRLGTSDDLEHNESTFSVEMKESAFILQRMSDRSLILIDELGRGTSQTDGFSLCWAISEKILRTSAYTLLASHYQAVTKLAALYPNVKNLHLQCQEGTASQITASYVVANGPSLLTQGYGIKTAEAAGFPKQILDKARSILDKVALVDPQYNQPNYGDKKCEAAGYQLARAILYSNKEPTALIAYLKTLRSQLPGAPPHA
eukprot:GHVN01013359.1.p1 GENE.GHVN01013359.1~~GHVN01013359.1.p1  ORF type:complete len:612 (+),score=79.86 GHVN01013359.1:770-2605(+)